MKRYIYLLILLVSQMALTAYAKEYKLSVLKDIKAQASVQITVQKQDESLRFYYDQDVMVEEGDMVKVAYYGGIGYNFQEWQNADGEVISTSSEIVFSMPANDVILQAVLGYAPTRPGEPGATVWDAENGEVNIINPRPGQLKTNINTFLTFNGLKYDDVKKLVISGNINDEDLGCLSNFHSLSVLDLSQVTGLIRFYLNMPLDELYMPAEDGYSISNTFVNNLANIKSVYMYSLVPPQLHILETHNDILTSNATLYVPEEAVALYRNDEIYSGCFASILPFAESLKVDLTLPDDCYSDGEYKYKDMHLDLMNTVTGQRIRYLVTKRSNYVFNCPPNSTWQARLVTKTDKVISEIEKISVQKSGFIGKMPETTPMVSIGAKVLTPLGEDVTEAYQMTWLNQEDNLTLGTGTSIANLLPGEKVRLVLKKTGNVNGVYLTPSDQEFTVEGEDKVEEVILENYPTIHISGTVIAPAEATVRVIQSKGNHTLKHGGDGELSLDVYKESGKIVIECPNTKPFEMSFDGSGDVMFHSELKTIYGNSKIKLNVNYFECSPEGPVQKKYENGKNLMFTIDSGLNDKLTCTNAYPYLYLDRHVAENVELAVTAETLESSVENECSKANVVMKDDGSAEATFTFTQKPYITATYDNSDNANVVGILYDSNGDYLMHERYDEKKLTIRDLDTDKAYSLVTMGENEWLNSVGKYKRLAQCGLVEGRDFVRNKIKTKHGTIEVINNPVVPVLSFKNELIDTEKSKLTASAVSGYVGTNITLTTTTVPLVDIKKAYPDAKLSLIYDITGSLGLFDYNIMQGTSYLDGVADMLGDSLVVPVNYIAQTDPIKFVVTPVKSGRSSISVALRVVNGNKTQTIPFGYLNFSSPELSLSVESIISEPTFKTSGMAPANSSVNVYANTKLIGTAQADAKGRWLTECTLDNPTNGAYYQVFGRATYPNGAQVSTSSKVCQYQKDRNRLRKVVMRYMNHNNGGSEDSIVYDMLENKVNKKEYMIYPIYPVTFYAYFDDNERAQLVTFNVWYNDAQWNSFDAKLEDTKYGRCWTFSKRFDNQFPTNITVSYLDDEKKYADAAKYKEMQEHVKGAYKNLKDLVAEYLELKNVADATADATKAKMEVAKKIGEKLGKAISTDEYFDVLKEYCEALGVDDTDVDDLDINPNDEKAVNKAIDDLASGLQNAIDDMEGEEEKVEEAEHIVAECEEMIGCTVDPDTVDCMKRNGYELKDETGKVIFSCLTKDYQEVRQVFESDGRGANRVEVKLPVTDDLYERIIAVLEGDGYKIYFKMADSNDVMYIDIASVDNLLDYLPEYGGDGKVPEKIPITDILISLSRIQYEKDMTKEEKENLLESNTNPLFTALGYAGQAISSSFFEYKDENGKIYNGEGYTFASTWESVIADVAERLAKCMGNEVLQYKYDLIAKYCVRHLRLSDVIAKNPTLRERLMQSLRNKAANAIEALSKNLPDKMAKVAKYSNNLSKFMGGASVLASAAYQGADYYKVYKNTEESVNRTMSWHDFQYMIPEKCDGHEDKLKEIRDLYDEWTAETYSSYALGSAVDLFGWGANTVLLAAKNVPLVGSLFESFSTTAAINEARDLLDITNAKTRNRYNQLIQMLSELNCYSKVEDKDWQPCRCQSVCEFCHGHKCLKTTTNFLGLAYVRENCHCNYLNTKRHKPKWSDGTYEPMPPGITPLVDPSGYVYEAVESNRVEGVTATIYYKEIVTDEFGDKQENVVLWDAENYDQINPEVTDKMGNYNWDVPTGLWKVKFEKYGYEPTETEWLPVPPPQLDINVPIVQYRVPNVEKAHVYEKYADIVFDKYMQTSSLTADNIKLVKMKGGEQTVVYGTSIEFLDADWNADKSELYACSLKLTYPEGTDLGDADEVLLVINKKVTSYAGVQMENNYSQTFDVEKAIESIVVDELYNVSHGSEYEILVGALPKDASKGKVMKVSSLLSGCLFMGTEGMDKPVDDELSVVLDENGEARITLYGSYLGDTELTFSVDGSNLEAKAHASVVDPSYLGEVASPTASRVSGTSLYRGQSVKFESATPGALIYYTVDGTCPCDEHGSRKLYDGNPIVITEPVTFLAQAFNIDGDGSDLVRFKYDICTTDIDLDLVQGWNWISHGVADNIMVEDMFPNAERVLSQTDELILDPVLGLVGGVTHLDPREAYKVKVVSDTKSQITGDEINVAGTIISLNEGWNWIGYPVNQTMTPDEAFALTSVDEGDMLIGQDGFCEYTSGGWIGSLLTMNPGQGYLYRSQSQKNMVYNNSIVSSARERLRNVGLRSDDIPWNANSRKYPHTMNFVATIDDRGNVMNDYVIGAFVDGECRGVSKKVGDKIYLTVYGEKAESLTFYAVNPADMMIYDVAESVIFANDVLGSSFAPFRLSIGQATDILATTTVEGLQPNGIYSVDGIKLNKMQSGINILRMPNGTVKKVMVK